jgi:hypothetical protein
VPKLESASPATAARLRIPDQRWRHGYFALLAVIVAICAYLLVRFPPRRLDLVFPYRKIVSRDFGVIVIA